MTPTKTQSNSMMKQGIKAGFPIVIGYLPVAITFGVLAKQTGLSLFELTSMSIFVYAGASQFMAVNMIGLGVSATEIILATFILNFRHFVMSFSFMNQLRMIPLRVKVPLTLGLTDETFAVSSMYTEEAKKEKGDIFYLTLLITAYLSWIGGSFLGGLLGNIIPEKLSQSMGIALYAMFIGLIIPPIKKELKLGLIALVAMITNTICSEVFLLSSGWSIVIGTIIGGLSGVFIQKEGNI
ncbi:AzlC family ABC transporter permease [Cerasibacillus terrae]|uniref:AzlC family ABC transporter permease n=1 Tax=Cerasibacillus terrae TaxID=2498845 RepID=A0A5C8NSN8_9BACI|nr:AzlC family ABC transporter permease [Cerasibacillus terrae]TXL63971.1 AzlC family ABC transporter permease [Cerasibacillus terrae]